MEFLFQRGAGFGNLREELFVFGQKVVHVAGASVRVIRILEVEVEVAGLDLVDGDAPCLFALDALLPPLSLRLEFLNADRLALVVALGAGRIRMLVVPDFLGRLRPW